MKEPINGISLRGRKMPLVLKDWGRGIINILGGLSLVAIPLSIIIGFVYLSSIYPIVLIGTVLILLVFLFPWVIGVDRRKTIEREKQYGSYDQSSEARDPDAIRYSKEDYKEEGI